MVCYLKVKIFWKACEGASSIAHAVHQSRHSHRLVGQAGGTGKWGCACITTDLGACSADSLHCANLAVLTLRPASPSTWGIHNSSFSEHSSLASSLSSRQPGKQLNSSVPDHLLQKPFLTLIFKPIILLSDITKLRANSYNKILYS